MTEPVLPIVILAALVGACIGSFLNVCIVRWPRGESVVAPPSRCLSCGRGVRWYENIPIASWLLLRGQCAGCKARISVQYPLVELLIAIVWAVAAWEYGATWLALRVAVFVTLLAGVAITDAKAYVIPDGFTLFGLGWMLFAAFLSLVFAASGEPVLFASAYDAVIGACVGAGAIAIIGWLGEIAFGREAMGFGDSTLMAVIGAALGANRALLAIFVAALLGVVTFIVFVYPLVWARSRRAGQAMAVPLVPFGVFLAAGAVVTLFYGEMLLQWYQNRFLGL